MVESLLPDMLGELEPFWADFHASGGSDFGPYLASRGEQVRGPAFCDRQARAASGRAAVVKAYARSGPARASTSRPRFRRLSGAEVRGLITARARGARCFGQRAHALARAGATVDVMPERFAPSNPTTRECWTSATASASTGRPAATPRASLPWRCTAAPGSGSTPGRRRSLTRTLPFRPVRSARLRTEHALGRRPEHQPGHQHHRAPDRRHREAARAPGHRPAAGLGRAVGRAPGLAYAQR